MKRKRSIEDLSVFFTPRLPDSRHTIWHILDILGVRVSSFKSGGDIGFLGSGQTYCEAPPKVDRHIINSRCLDISKSYVDICFEKSFGYSVTIDPLKYQGIGIRKSEENYAHDGKILQFPIKAKEHGYVYNYLVNNINERGLVEDLRVPIVGDEIPFVYRVYKKIENRFMWSEGILDVCHPEDVFTKDEIGKINAFCREMEFEFGELDVLRDRSGNQALFIVDANRAPALPPNKIFSLSSRRTLRYLADSFSRQFLIPILKEENGVYWERKLYKIRFQHNLRRPFEWSRAILLRWYREFKR